MGKVKIEIDFYLFTQHKLSTHFLLVQQTDKMEARKHLDCGTYHAAVNL